MTDDPALNVGADLSTGAPVAIPVSSLRRHVAVLGSSGSGKTVLCKVLVEEAVRNGIPVIAVDPQGDVASLALAADPAAVAQHGVAPEVQQEFLGKARVAIFTPASSKGIPISVRPLRFPGPEALREDAVLALDMTAASLAGILGYDLGTPAGKAARAALFSVMDSALKRQSPPKDLAELARLLVDPPKGTSGDLRELVTKKEAEEIARKVKYLTVGASSLLFEMGTPLDIDRLLDRRDGKVPLNVIYLNTLTSDADKQFFLTVLLREVYLWMIRHPSDDVQLVLYVDEVAPYIPPYPRNPPPKVAYALLFKQARKYGVSLFAATQNITDLDYKALGQVSTWCLGRFVMQQDVQRVAKIVQSIDPAHADAILASLPGLATSQFFLVSPDAHGEIVKFQNRWLVTEHRTLEEGQLADAMSPAVRSSYVPEPPTAVEVAPAPAAASAPSAPDATPPTAPSGLADAIGAALAGSRQALSAPALAARMNLPAATVSDQLRGLVRAKVLVTGQVPGTTDDLYWIRDAGFQPAIGLTAEVLSLPMRIAQVDAVKQASSLIDRERLLKKETVAAAVLARLPLWRVTCRWTTKAILAAPKEHVDDYFVSARSGAFLSIVGKEMRFETVAHEVAERLENLNGAPGVEFLPMLPKEAAPLPPIKRSLAQASEILRRTFGVTPAEGRLVLLPVWNLTLQRKDTGKSRTVTLDAVLGKVLVGAY